MASVATSSQALDVPLPTFLARTDLQHLTMLHTQSLGALLLRCEDRIGLLGHLKAEGVTSLQDRQKCANALGKARRACTMDSIHAAGHHAVFHADALLAICNRYQGAIGVLFSADGSIHHVNEAAQLNPYGAYNISPVASYCKLDGPVLKMVSDRAIFAGRPIYVPSCDEDPFVDDPPSAFLSEQHQPPRVNAAKLAATRADFGSDVLVLTTARVRDTASVPCVGLLPAFDSWAAASALDTSSYIGRLRSGVLRADLPFAKRLDRLVWRGMRTGGPVDSSLRGRVVQHCNGKPWADVAFVPDMHTHGRGSSGELCPGELTREQQACYKMILAVDGNAWASCWEWGLASGSVLIYLGIWSLHLMDELRPWVHYVPCASVDDLEQCVLWVLSHRSEAEQMAVEAHKLFQRVATPEHSMKVVRESLISLASLREGD